MADRNKRSSASFVPFKPLDNLFEPTVAEKPAPTENGLKNLLVDDLHSWHRITDSVQKGLRMLLGRGSTIVSVEQCAVIGIGA